MKNGYIIKGVLVIILFFYSLVGVSLEKDSVFECKSAIELLKIGDSFSYSTFVRSGCMSSICVPRDSIVIQRNSLFYEFRYKSKIFHISNDEIKHIIARE